MANRDPTPAPAAEEKRRRKAFKKPQVRLRDIFGPGLIWGAVLGLRRLTLVAVAGLGEALHGIGEKLPTWRGQNEQTMAHATASIAGLSGEVHRQEKEIVGVEGQVSGRHLVHEHLAGRTRGGPPGGTLAIAAIALAMVFSVWMAGATGAEAVQRGTVLILIGIPVYVVTRRTNPEAGQGAR